MALDDENLVNQFEGDEMIKVRRPTTALFVDRGSQRWIARDADGNFWIVPMTDNPWNDRQPFNPDDETELEPIPGHYKSMLRMPT